MRLKVSNVCQLINKAKIDATKTVYGVTFTNDGSGVIIANGGPSTAQGAFYVDRDVIIDPTHIYLNPKSADIPGNYALGCDLYGDGSYIPGGESGYERDVPFKFNSRGDIAVFYYVIFANKTVSNLRLIPQLFDLTEMYGEGNEPTTVEQFRADFPNEMYEYSPVCWKKFRRLKYVTETKNLFDISNADIISKDYCFTPNQGPVSNFYVMTVTPDTTYTVSYERFINSNDTGAPSALELSIQTGTHYTDGTQLFFALGGGERGVWITRSKQFTVPSGINQVTFSGLKDRFLYRNFMVQEGSTAFPYQPYGYLPLRRGKFIANKEPVQLLDKSDFKTAVSKGVTATPNTTNGMWTISGAATASEYLAIGSYRLGTNFDIGDKLFLRNSNIDNSVYFPYAGWYDKDNKYLGEYDGMGVFSVTNPETAYIACYFATRTVADINVTTQVQLFNLTRMYGVGNEPTAAEFVAQYSGFDYPVNKYNAITFR